MKQDSLHVDFAKKIKAHHVDHLLGIRLKKASQDFIENLLSILFPHFCKEKLERIEEIASNLVLIERELKAILSNLVGADGLVPNEIVSKFMQKLPQIYDKLWLDAEAINSGDPAAESVDEVILAYPGFTAIAIYRIAHEFYQRKVPIFPRLLTEYAHQITGIDIHPGARIGESFAIDHGTGIVIGESTIIGNNVKLYQGVTLGALSVDKKMAKSKRHPTIEDNVVIYAQAVILGGETVVGHHSVIGGNVWLTRSVPPYSTVYQDSKITVKQQDQSLDNVNSVTGNDR